MSSPLRDILHLDAVRTAPARFRLLHVFGAVAILLLIVEVATGVLLLAYYQPTADGAHRSIGVLVDEVTFGWLVRSLHAWAADLLILFGLLHLVRVYFSHAYQAPRQLNWTTGVLLLLVMLAFGFTGSLLPWDQYAYWSTEAARRAVAVTPVLGTLVLDLLWGGWALGEEVLLRFYVFHIGVLPWLAAGLLWLHLMLVWHFGLTEPSPAAQRRQRPPSPFFPDFVLDLLMALLLIAGLLLSLATLFPPAIGAPADALTPLPAVTPRWYFLPLHQLLQLLSGRGAALAVIAVVVILLLVPVIDGRPVRSSWRRIVRWSLGGLVIAGVVWGMHGYLW